MAPWFDFRAKVTDVPLFQSAQTNSGTYQVSYAMGMGAKQPWREAAHSAHPMTRFKSPPTYKSIPTYTQMAIL